jgi:competence CoiA-like predicted nuclease
MALKALVNGKLTRAEDLSKDQFRYLQLQKPQVAMLCCQTRGYMRIREDYQEFVHFRRIHDCLGRPDSPTHDFLKRTVRDAARGAGWDADFEVPDPQPERRWIADVFAHKGKAQVAIEIQISPITREELAERQQIYAACGIRSC